MSTIVAKRVVTRKKGYLYFIDGEGNVKEAKMNRKGGKTGRKVCSTSKPAKKRTVKKKAAPKKKAGVARKKVVRKKAATKKRATRKRTTKRK